MKSVVLVACVSGKQEISAPAKDLYTSPLFVKSRHLVEITGLPWFILSAKHGLLHPDTVIDPYDKTLSKSVPKQYRMNKAERRAWVEKVQHQIHKELTGVEKIIFLAGNDYRECLVPWLKLQGLEVSVPMEGLGIGRQLGWLDRATTL